MSKQRQSDILRTKLYRPRMPRDFVCRLRLHKVLDQGPITPLTLVSAPAGYGKSLLVSHWSDLQETPCAWFSLDESDSKVSSFLDYLLFSIETVAPGSCPLTRQMVNAAELPPLGAMVRSLSNELEGMDGPLILVLDDYHRIQGASEIQELVRSLLAHPPTHLHLVIVTRRDPPLGLTRLRAQGQLTEVRQRDLRFTPAETQQLLQISVEGQLSEAAIVNLQQEVEGWAVGLRLVSLALRQVGDPDAFLKQLQGGIWSIHRYLLQEVIQGQPADLRDGLLRCAILNRFCAGLYDDLCTPEDPSKPVGITGEEFVRELHDQNLFTIPLDEKGEWFRYHHLFQELLGSELEQHLEPSQIEALHLKASRWFESNGYITEAIEHALKAVDPEYAAEILERHRMAELGPVNTNQRIGNQREVNKEQEDNIQLIETGKDSAKTF